MTEEFKKYMTGFNFKRISISVFHEFYNLQGRKATKQQLTKWLTEYSQTKGKKLVKTISHNVRSYRFDDLDCSINEDALISLSIRDYVHIPDKDVKEVKRIISTLKFTSNNKYRFSTEEYSGKKLLFRIS